MTETPTAIDPDKVKQFWERRGEKLGSVPFESLANLEEKPDLLNLKVELEQACIFPLLPVSRSTSLLDLGAGVGQWSLRFAPLVEKVVAVEYAAALAEIGRVETARRGVRNIEWVVSPAEAYRSERPFDVVFISGLFVYLTDAQCSRLMQNLRALVKDDGIVILRDGTSILPHRHQITDRWSENLQTSYSAVYRTAQEYAEIFAAAGFSREKDGQVFPEGCPLNKYSETRLRYYVFRPRA